MNLSSVILQNPFDLDATVSSGQFFRWRIQGEGYLIQHRENFFYVEHHNDILKYHTISGNMNDAEIRRFFGLDDNLDAIFQRWDSPFLQSVYRKYRGLRLIRQDPWECTVSFICSMASNIPRITRNIHTLAKRFGTVIQTPNGKIFRLPTPTQLARVSLANLYDTGVGFRAKYLYGLARNTPDFGSLQSMDYSEAKTVLLSVKGIGEKVADCILLFSLNHLGAFPVDTWIKKALQTWIFPGKTGSPAQLATEARNYFGENAGYAQQYLFHHARTTL